MFITLKARGGKRPKGTGMEELASTNAGAGGASCRYGANRRVACVACQKKKIRCTGSGVPCNQCHTHRIACSFSKALRQTRRGRLASRKAAESDKRGELPPTEPLEQVDGGGNYNAAPELCHLPELSSISPSAFPGFFISDDPQSMTLTPEWDMYGMQADHLLSHPDASCTALPYDGSQGQAPPCSCVDGALGIIQRLDDDEFHLRSLTFDQLLKLKKWLIMQCLQPLQCAGCAAQLRTQTLILIVAGRMLEMFQCIADRLDRILKSLTSPDEQYSIGLAFSIPVELGATNSKDENFKELFDADSGEPGLGLSCNMNLFSPHFQSQYSKDEQYQMIQVLTRSQAANFTRLLERVGALSDEGQSGSRARAGKIQSMIHRLASLTSQIEASLEGILQALQTPC